MKIFGAINDGYRFIYSQDETIMKDWLYVNQEHFCILKIFNLDVEETEFLKTDSHLDINYKFDKRKITQKEYKDLENDNFNHGILVIFEDGLGKIVETEVTKENEQFFMLKLTHEEKVILNATRNHQRNRD